MAEFGTLDLEDMMEEGGRINKSGNNNNFYEKFLPMPNVKPGQTGSIAIRILPPLKGAKLFQYNRIHTVNDRKCHCPRMLVGGKFERTTPCPICDYYQQLWRQADKLKKMGRGDEAKLLIGEASKIKPVERYYYNCIARTLIVDGLEQKNAGPKVLSIGIILHQKIVRAITGAPDDPNVKLGNVTDLKAGWDFIIRKKVQVGEENYPTYTESDFARQQSPAGTPEEIAKWLEGLHDLTELRSPKDLAHMEKELAIHRGLIPDDAEIFNTASFDAKWKTAGAGVVQAAVAAAKTGSCDVPPPVVNVETVSSPSEGLADDAFVKELEDLAGKM